MMKILIIITNMKHCAKLKISTIFKSPYYNNIHCSYIVVCHNQRNAIINIRNQFVVTFYQLVDME